MQQKIEAAENFDEVWSKGDGLALLEIIKSITYVFQSQKYTGQLLFESYKKFFNQVQGRTTTVKEHLTNFNNRVNVIESTGGSFSLDPGMLRYVLNGKKEEELDEEQLAIVHKEVRDRTLGASFMMTSDRGRFGKLIEGIDNDCNEGRNRWPASVADAYHRLTYYSNNPRLGQRKVGGEGEIAFVNANGDTGSKKKAKAKNKKNITCHRCKKKGHYANECNGDCVSDKEDKKPTPEKKKQIRTMLLTEGAYDTDFLDDQEE